MRQTYITALTIAALILFWFLSGQSFTDDPIRHPTLAENNERARAQNLDALPTRVRAQVIHASSQTQHVVLRGRTESKRSVQVRAETAGRIVGRPVERGTAVAAGDLLCRISTEDRHVGLIESQESLSQARIEHLGILALKQKGFQSDTAIAKSKARLAAAQAELKRSQLDLERTYVRAPFAGTVEELHLEIGDFVATGAPCVTLVDLDPMLLVGRAAEKDVHRLKLDQLVSGLLSDGRQVSGPVTFIGQQSDPATRTYAVEVQIANPDYSLRSGVTTKIRIPVAQVMAQRVSPAVFALDDAGDIGVRIINKESRVEFLAVQIVREGTDGMWVSGLPDTATVITVGQELVVPGELVEVDYEAADGMPAAAPGPDDSQRSSQINTDPVTASVVRRT
jgi:multidrug efflux system membrane fusion protein